MAFNIYVRFKDFSLRYTEEIIKSEIDRIVPEDLKAKFISAFSMIGSLMHYASEKQIRHSNISIQDFALR